MTIGLKCYSGYKADQRSLRFRLDDRECAADEILAPWCGPDRAYFRLRASDGHAYILRHAASADQNHWTPASSSE
jgi:hypothetical protein